MTLRKPVTVSEELWLKLNEKQREQVVRHELGHLLIQAHEILWDLCRAHRDSKDVSLFNAAADYLITLAIRNNIFRNDYHNMEAELVYDKLVRQAK